MQHGNLERMLVMCGKQKVQVTIVRKAFFLIGIIEISVKLSVQSFNEVLRSLKVSSNKWK